MSNSPGTSGVVSADKAACHGCGICELVCSLSHNGACGPALSRIHVFRDPLAGEFSPETCKQCRFPSCYYSCPAGAVEIDADTGARVIEADKCEGCGLCAKACLFNEQGTMIKHDPARGIYFKCDLCSSVHSQPLCVKACPWGALSYISSGKRLA